MPQQRHPQVIAQFGVCHVAQLGELLEAPACVRATALNIETYRATNGVFSHHETTRRTLADGAWEWTYWL